MTSETPTSHPLLVALSLVANHDEHLLWFARDLSRRLRIPIKLVHACEDLGAAGTPFSWIDKWVPRGLRARIPVTAPSESIALAEKTLCEIARRLSLKGCGCTATQQDMPRPPTTPKDAEVRTEKPAGRALSIAAAESHASILLVGAKEPALWFNWGAANVRELLAESPCPVLILRRDLAIDPSRERMGIVLADDLTDSTIQVVETAFRLASRCEGASLLHVHVAPQSASAADLQAASKTLERRSAPFRAQLTHHLGTYQATVVQGDPLNAVLNIVRETDTDILVTGDGAPYRPADERDKAQPKAIKHPPSKWLAASCALLVVPRSCSGLTL